MLSRLRRIIDCGNGLVRALGSKIICVPESFVVLAGEGIQMTFFVPDIDDGKIILFPCLSPPYRYFTVSLSRN